MKYIALLSLSFFSVSALADISATWQHEDAESNISIQYRDDNHMRMSIGEDGYLLVNGDKAYSVFKEGNRWMAMDMKKMAESMKALGPMHQQMMQAMGHKQEKYVEPKISFSATGRSEIVAGIKGQVYNVVVTEANGERERAEVVLAKDARIAKISKAFRKVINQMSAFSMGDEGVIPEDTPFLNTEKGGLLRYEQEMKLTSLNENKLPADYFNLPAGVQMMDMPGAAPGMPPGGMPPGMPADFEMPDMEEIQKQMQQLQQQYGGDAGY